MVRHARTPALPSEASFARVASARLGGRARTVSPGPTTLPATDDDSSSEGYSNNRSRSTSEQFEPPPQHPARRPSVHMNPNRTPRHVRSPSYQSYHFHPPHQPPGFSKSSSSPSFPEPLPPSPAEAVELSSPLSPSDSPFTGGPSVGSGVLRPSRSQSMHSPVSPTLAGRLSGSTSPQSTGGPGNTSSPNVVPPPRRKRPESMQVPPRRNLPEDKGRDADLDPLSPFSNTFDVRGDPSGQASDGVASRLFQDFNNASQSNEKDHVGQRGAPFATLQRTFTALHQRAQPSLARARYKAEANFNPRRGFIPPPSSSSRSDGGLGHWDNSEGASSRLVSGDRNDGDESDAGIDEDFGYIDLNGRDDEDALRGRERAWRKDLRSDLQERDNLKLPEGEGWRPL